MKRIILTLTLLITATIVAAAQSTVKYGYLSYDALLHSMSAYADAQEQINALRQKYEAETQYNESSFKRQFSEFLQGQKDFPQNILLKRQRDLQEAVERSIAFRHEADSLLAQAEAEIMAPVREQLNEAIRAVGLERGYEYIINTDLNTVPFVHPSVAEDATLFVTRKLAQ